jgi:hypothetical protein
VSDERRYSAPAPSRGGRRPNVALDEGVRAIRREITLSVAADAALTEIMAARGLSRSEVLRRLLLDPGAADVVDRG